MACFSVLLLLLSCLTMTKCGNQRRLSHSYPDCIDRTLYCLEVGVEMEDARTNKIEYNTCNPPSWFCDGHNECFTAGDLSGAEEETDWCRQFRFDPEVSRLRVKPDCQCDERRCDDGTCIRKELWCSGSGECPDFSDEADCPDRSPVETICPEGELYCMSTKMCYPKSARCDGKVDCPLSKPYEGYHFLPFRLDYDDEWIGYCDKEACKNGQWKCGDGTCLYQRYMCDGKFDCDNDETPEVCGQKHRENRISDTLDDYGHPRPKSKWTKRRPTNETPECDDNKRQTWAPRLESMKKETTAEVIWYKVSTAATVTSLSTAAHVTSSSTATAINDQSTTFTALNKSSDLENLPKAFFLFETATNFSSTSTGSPATETNTTEEAEKAEFTTPQVVIENRLRLPVSTTEIVLNTNILNTTISYSTAIVPTGYLNDEEFSTGDSVLATTAKLFEPRPSTQRQPDLLETVATVLIGAGILIIVVLVGILIVCKREADIVRAQLEEARKRRVTTVETV